MYLSKNALIRSLLVEQVVLSQNIIDGIAINKKTKIHKHSYMIIKYIIIIIYELYIIWIIHYLK